MAELLQLNGDLDAAEALFVKASAQWREVKGDKHPSYADSLSKLAGICEQKGDYVRAESLYLQAMEILGSLGMGEEHPSYTPNRENLLQLRRSMIREAASITREVSLLAARFLDGPTPDDAHPAFRQLMALCRDTLKEEKDREAGRLNDSGLGTRERTSPEATKYQPGAGALPGRPVKTVPQPPTWKTVRIFLSSTFRDMHAERDHLAKVTFPSLRQWCEENRLHLVDIDLRWGVTKDEVDNGKAIEICLTEIDGSRPFFVCILGERYRWVPPELPPEEKYSFGSLQTSTGCSITHLEIIHATQQSLNLDPDKRQPSSQQAFFYFRDPDSLPDPQSLTELSEWDRRIFQQTFFEQDEDRARKLAELKQSLRDRYESEGRVSVYSGLWQPHAHNPEDPELKGRLTRLDAFGELVRKNLERAIREQFADHIASLGVSDPLAEERSYHEAFVETRTRVHVPRTDVEQGLLRYVMGNDPRTMIVSGPAGSGKSATLAHWTNMLRRDVKTANTFMLVRFVGASAGSLNLHHLLFNLIQQGHDRRPEIPAGQDESIGECVRAVLQGTEDPHPNQGSGAVLGALRALPGRRRLAAAGESRYQSGQRIPPDTIRPDPTSDATIEEMFRTEAASVDGKDPYEFDTPPGRIQAFATFVTGHSHVIATHPRETIPMARNHADSGIVAERALPLAEALDRLWVARDPRPPRRPSRPACVRTLEWTPGAERRIAVSFDASTLVSGDEDGTVQVWELTSGALIQTLSQGGAHPSSSWR